MRHSRRFSGLAENRLGCKRARATGWLPLQALLPAWPLPQPARQRAQAQFQLPQHKRQHDATTSW